MNTKPDPNTSKTSPSRPVRKSVKGATDTSRLFIDVNDMVRRTQSLPLTRYVESLGRTGGPLRSRLSPQSEAGSVLRTQSQHLA